MATCEELLTDMSLQQASITACDVQIAASNMIKSAAQTQYWIDSMNYYLQGCGSMGMRSTSESPAETPTVPSLYELLNPPGELLQLINGNPEAWNLLQEGCQQNPELVKPRDIVGIGPGGFDPTKDSDMP